MIGGLLIPNPQSDPSPDITSEGAPYIQRALLVVGDGTGDGRLEGAIARSVVTLCIEVAKVGQNDSIRLLRRNKFAIRGRENMPDVWGYFIDVLSKSRMNGVRDGPKRWKWLRITKRAVR